jgi:hypothetical protein
MKGFVVVLFMKLMFDDCTTICLVGLILNIRFAITPQTAESGKCIPEIFLANGIAHSGVASLTIWSCYANITSSLFISLEIDCFHSL